MQCREFAELLEQEPDGPLPGTAVDHLDSCSNCRFLLDDLGGIRAAGLDWGADELALPDRVWFAVRRQLETEGLIRTSTPFGWLNNWFAGALRPALLGASASLLLVATALLNLQTAPPPTATVARGALVPVVSQSAVLSEDLERTLDGDMRRVMASLPVHRASLETSLRQNLNIVDNFIAVCEKSVREQPDNPVAREYLYGAYQQKAVLLSAAMDRTTLEAR